jgi:hypothetical protein
MPVIVYWILVRDSTLAFRDGRMWSPANPAQLKPVVATVACGKAT